MAQPQAHPGREALDVRIDDVVEDRLHVTSVAQRDPPANNLHVLSGHRPGSISPSKAVVLACPGATAPRASPLAGLGAREHLVADVDLHAVVAKFAQEVTEPLQVVVEAAPPGIEDR